MQNDNLPNSLTPDQYQTEVIQASGGYHLVLAAPGCGKTQILTERIRRAHEQGISFDEMLCLTFTNRAARGMRERIETHINDEEIAELYVGNVHRFCSKFLFDNSLVPAESSVIDDDDAFSILARYRDDDEYAVQHNFRLKKEYIEVLHFAGFIHQLTHHHPKHLRLHPECVTSLDVASLRTLCRVQRMELTAETLQDVFKNADMYESLIHTDAYDIGSQHDIEALLRKMQQAKYYIQYKKENKLLDFEDLLMFTYDALNADDQLELKRYRWIQVDEVQDLNPLQLALVDGFTSKDFHTVMYLGDEQQAIFSFMGAKMSTLDALKQRCEGHLHRLFVNHRSPRYLLQVFNTFAEKMLDIDPALLPTTDFDPPRQGDELQLMSSEQVEAEYADVADKVQRLQEQYPQETTAVIVSSNADAELMSEALKQRNLPHFKVSGEDVFASSEVKLLLAHLNVLCNEHQFMGWSRLLKGLQVFESNAAARRFVRGLFDNAMLPSDLLMYPNSSYVQAFVECYEQQDIVVFDTETTGLNVFEDDIVQIAAVRMRRGCVVPGSEFVVFMRTNREIPRKLGNIDNPLLEEMQHHQLYSSSEGLKMFMEYVGNSRLLGHNADYDYHIFNFNLQRYLPDIQLEERCNMYFDSLKLIRLLEPNLKEYKLKYLLSVLHLEGQNSHLADADVHATCSVVRHCYEKAKLHINSQREWIQHPRFQQRAAVFRKRYLEIYTHARQLLYQRQHSGDLPVLATEIAYLYRTLCEQGLLQTVEKLPHVIKYLSADMIDQDAYPSLIEQLSVYINEINTLKEADLCHGTTLDERIFVTTVHKAKGLEFDQVVLFDAVDGRYPNYFNRDNVRLVAEDKRKFYVAMTRAKQRLYVSWSRNRVDYHNQLQPRYLTPFMKPLLHFFEVLA
ncbi:3'-5' exonuclease [Hoylesella timonensis]|uniref:3'-5' exonuclease n=1 Tax=Hoylesella timonensis TaxID=386414 RepID=UPI00336A6670